MRQQPDVAQQIRENPEEVLRIITWFLSRDAPTKLRCMFAGGVQDVTQETYLALLKYPPRSDVACTLATTVCNQVRWTLCRLIDRAKLPIDDSADLSKHADDSNPDLFGRLERLERRESVASLLRTISYRRRLTIEMRFGLRDGGCYTLEQVAKVFKVTRARVHQIEMSAISKLRYRCIQIQRFSGLME